MKRSLLCLMNGLIFSFKNKTEEFIMKVFCNDWGEEE
jgi:hypothetical protein